MDKTYINNYKTIPMEALNEIEKKKNELNREYGYNFECDSKNVLEVENLIKRPQNGVNHEYISHKR